MVKRTKDAFVKVGATIVGLATLDNLMKVLKSEIGDKATKTLFGKLFNFGPNDEAIMDTAISEIEDDPQARAEMRMRFEDFFKEMKENDLSVEWFKAVMVKKNRDWKIESGTLSPAARTFAAIDKGINFEAKVKISTSELIHKTIVSRVKEGWHVVAGENGKLKLLIDPDKINAIFSQGIEDFKGGFTQPLIPNKPIRWSVIAGALIILILVAYVFGTA